MSALDPLFQVWRFRADGGVITMSGTDGGLCRKVQNGGLQGFDDGVEGAVLASRGTWATWKRVSPEKSSAASGT